MAHEIDFDDEDAVLVEVAEALGEDPDDLKIDDTGRGLTSFGEGTVYYVQTRGRGQRGWCVAESDDAAREVALAVVKQDLEQEPGIFNKDFIESHINTEQLARDLHADVKSERYDYYSEMDAEDFWRDAEGYGMAPKYTVTWDNGHATGTLPGEYDDEDDAEAAGAEWKAEMVAADENPEEAEDEYDYEVVLSDPTDGEIDELADKATDELLKDPMSYLEDIYGREEAVEQAIKIAGIDIDAAAEDAVDTDGWQHFLAHYDGNSHETEGGLVYWRTD